MIHVFRLLGLALFSLVLATSNAAEARVSATFQGSFDGIDIGEIYGLQGTTAQTDVEDVLTEIGKRIRQRYYIDGYEVEGYGGDLVKLEDAYTMLTEERGEFRGLSAEDIEVLKEWVAKNQVEYVQAAGITTSYYSGTGMEDLYIFVPKMPATQVLVLRAHTYAE